MAARKRKTRPLSKKDHQGLALIAVLAVALLGLIGLRFAVADPKHYDEKTLCAVDAPTDHLVVLIDKSEPLSPYQAAFVRGRIEQAVDDMVAGERLSLFVLDDHSYELEPVFSKCSPGDGSSASPLYQNPALLRRRFEDAFRGPLERALTGAVTGQQAKSSPIMETLQVISMNPSFREADAVRRRLLIVSDMLQNMPYFSQHVPDANDFEAFVQKTGPRAPTAHLDQVEVEVIYLIRSHYARLQGLAHVTFWQKWIARMGGHLRQMESVR